MNGTNSSYNLPLVPLKTSVTFGTATSPTFAANDNDTYFVTSDGTASGTVQEFWKYDKETNTWVNLPISGATCPAPMTRAQLRALRTAGSLSKDCHYVITNPNAQGTLTAQEIILHAVNSNTLSMQAGILTSHDVLAWQGVYDIDADDVLEVTDNLENKVISNASIINFPFGVTAVNGNTVKSRSNVIYTSGNFINNTLETDSTVNAAGNIQRNSFEANSNTTVSSGDFRENKIENDATVISSTTGDVDGNTFGNNSNSTISGTANVDNNIVDMDANINVSGGSLVQSRVGQLAGYIQTGGVLRESNIGQDADVTIASGDNYENQFGNSTIYRQVGTGYIRYSTIEGTTSWINGNTNVSNVTASTATVNTTGSAGTISNSTLNRAICTNMQNIPSLTITDSTISSYGTVQGNGASRIYIYRGTIDNGARVLCGAGSRIDMSYSNINSYGYVQTTLTGSELYVNYTKVEGYSYIRNLTSNSHRVDRCRVASSSNLRFEQNATGCRAYYTTVDGGSALYFNGTSTNCYAYYNSLNSIGQMYFTNSVNARYYYNSVTGYGYLRSLNATGTHYAYYCASMGRGYITHNGATGRFYGVTAQGQSIVELRGGGAGNLYYSSFSAYFYAYITRLTGTTTGLFGMGRRTQTITNPTVLTPYAVSSAWLNF